jgi:hypothetical protein
MTNDELLAVQRGRAAFLADVDRVVRVIAERHRAQGAPLTWQLVRDICDEALADIGLAARWPAERIEQLAVATSLPPVDSWLTPADTENLFDLARPIAQTFGVVNPT